MLAIAIALLCTHWTAHVDSGGQSTSDVMTGNPYAIVDGLGEAIVTVLVIILLVTVSVAATSLAVLPSAGFVVIATRGIEPKNRGAIVTATVR